MASSQFHGGDSSISYGLEDSQRIVDIFYWEVIAQRFFGQIPIPAPKFLPESMHRAWKIIDGIYSFILIATPTHLCLLFIKTFLDALPTGQLDNITDALMFVIIYSFATFSASYWFFRSKQLLTVFNRINSDYRHHSMAGISFVNVQPVLSFCRKFTIFWISACVLANLCWGMQPLVRGKRALPLQCWYPFDPLAEGTYALIYIWQIFAQGVLAGSFAPSVTLYVTLCFLILSQFDVLYCSLKNLDANARLLTGDSLKELRKLQNELLFDSTTKELNEYMLVTEYRSDLEALTHFQRERASNPQITMNVALHEALVECVRLHRFILYVCEELERFFSPYCLVKLVELTLLLCLLAFVGVAGTRDTLRIINQLQYLILTLFELFLFTYLGELLKRHSVRSGEAFWRSEWWRYSHKIRRDAQIFIENSQREVQVTAGKLMTMDVDRLRSVCTQAFSFLTLLQNIELKKEEEPSN